MNPLCATLMLALFIGPGWAGERPRLVAVVSLDQFRYDYLEQFGDNSGDSGFNRFLRGGSNFRNTHYQHSATRTGPGHAVILSGMQANANGIIANSWINPANVHQVCCVEDTSAGNRPRAGANGALRIPD